tara:strand:- start:22411 stop:22608 length:198 start_codon:yes stop_codon:yes gene_type:complete
MGQLKAQDKAWRNRIHLYLSCASRPREVQRLVEMGAAVRDIHKTYAVMLDPEGNEFCVEEPVRQH